jgi:N-acetylglucosaminyldiphosphoundecaprenol N-acetyl-beta-D-mannosaminyltransferase
VYTTLLRRFSLICIAAFASGAGAATYHVDALLGNDSWSGTAAAPNGTPPNDGPWRTLARVGASSLAPCYFYGSTDSTLAALTGRLAARFPRLRIAGMHAPPFRKLSADEDAAIVERINASGAGVVFVGLGCPKQEKWMAQHRGRVQAVMIGVGAAFDYHAGVIRRAPRWMQNSGLEWLHRLCSEPRRLWRRYLVTNTLFLVGVSRRRVRRRD